MDYLSLNTIAKTISGTLSPQVECVIHDLSQPGFPILAIYNPQISNRKVGDKTTIFQTLDADINTLDVITNYTLELNNKSLKSSSVIFKEAGQPRYALSINVDNTYINEAIGLLSNLTNFKPKDDSNTDDPNQPITYELVKNELYKCLMDNSLSPTSLTNENKRHVILQLKSSGLLNRRTVIPHLSDLLNISKMTIYNYMKTKP